MGEIITVQYDICGAATDYRHIGSACDLETALVVMRDWTGLARTVTVSRQWRDSDGLWDGEVLYTESRASELGGMVPVLAGGAIVKEGTEMGQIGYSVSGRSTSEMVHDLRVVAEAYEASNPALYRLLRDAAGTIVRLDPNGAVRAAPVQS